MIEEYVNRHSTPEVVDEALSQMNKAMATCRRGIEENSDIELGGALEQVRVAYEILRALKKKMNSN